MEELKQQYELCFDGKLSVNWKKSRRNFDNYLTAINLLLKEKSPTSTEPTKNAAIARRQIAMFLHIAGD